MQVKNLKAFSGQNSLKAFFDVETSEGVLIKGFKLSDSKNGLFVGVPADQDRNDKSKYWNKVIMTKEQLSDLLEQAKAEYQKVS